MFTGLVEELGTVEDVGPTGEGIRIRVLAPRVREDLAPGDSIAVNGVCLTAVDLGDSSFTVEAVGETLARTTLSDLSAGSKVHLERSLSVGDRLGGHWVQGHVDGTGRIELVRALDRDFALRILLPSGLERYVVEKGSIAVDGVSLTVGKLVASGRSFWVHLIPETLRRTHLGACRPGDRVNLEVDLLAKYVEKLLPRESTGTQGSELSPRARGLLKSWNEEAEIDSPLAE